MFTTGNGMRSRLWCPDFVSVASTRTTVVRNDNWLANQLKYLPVQLHLITFSETKHLTSAITLLPPAAQGLIELDERREFVASRLRKL